MTTLTTIMALITADVAIITSIALAVVHQSSSRHYRSLENALKRA